MTTLDLELLEYKTRYAQSVPVCVVTKEELDALVRIANAARAYTRSGEDDPLWTALREGGLL